MVEAIVGSRPVMISSLMRVQNSSRKLSVPVKPYVTRYAQFKHIVGVPSSENSSSVPLAKLQILDNLIEKITGKRGQAEAFMKMTSGEADRLISALRSEYGQKLAAGEGISFKPEPSQGMILNIFA